MISTTTIPIIFQILKNRHIEVRLCGTCRFFLLPNRKIGFSRCHSKVLFHLEYNPKTDFGSELRQMSTNIVDITSFVQKAFSRINYNENNVEKGIDIKNQKKSLPIPVVPEDAVSNSQRHEKLNDQSIRRNNANVDFTDKKMVKIRFVGVNSLLAIREHLTPNLYVDESIDGPTLVRNIQNKFFNNRFLYNTTHISLYSQPNDDNHAATKSHIDSLSENERRCDLTLVMNNRNKDFSITTSCQS